MLISFIGVFAVSATVYARNVHNDDVKECFKTGPCSCRTPDLGDIDLSPLAKDKGMPRSLNNNG